MNEAVTAVGISREVAASRTGNTTVTRAPDLGGSFVTQESYTQANTGRRR